jgi:tRNA (cytidine/uridine-2'-O-)-methyltransferase
MAVTPLTLALYQPDIPQNAGSMLRTCACLDFEAAIIGPAGFPVTDRDFRRAGMDYLDQVVIRRHVSFEAFLLWRAMEDVAGAQRRLILLTTKTSTTYVAVDYRPGDILLVGRETSGVPKEVAEVADLAITIPMRPGARSLNVGVAAAIVMSEARRQLSDF